MSKVDARLDCWVKDIAPSAELRVWFDHDPARWDEFQRRYRAELSAQPHVLRDIRRRAREGRVTLVYAARDQAHNDAVVLRNVLLGRPQTHRSRS